MDNIFSGIDTVTANQDLQKQYFLPGQYRVRLENVLVHKKRLGGHIFIAETTVLESDNPEIKPGELRNWVQPLEVDAAMPRIKCFIGATQGLDPKRQIDAINKNVTQKLCESVVLNEISIKNVELRLECFNKRSIRTGKDFTLHIWGPTEDKNLTEN